MQRVQGYRRLFTAVLSAALSLQAADIRISSFSCAEYTLFNSSSSSAASFDYSLTDKYSSSVEPSNPAGGTLTGRTAEDAGVATETTYADVSTIFTVAMPAAAQERAKILNTILQDSFSIFAAPMSRFFSVPVRAVYAARAEQQAADKSVETAGPAAKQLPSRTPAPDTAAAGASAEQARAVTYVPSTAGNAKGEGSKQQNSTMAVSTDTSSSSPQADALEQHQQLKQQAQQQQHQQPKQQPLQEQADEQLAAGDQLAAPVPVSASDTAQKKKNATALAAPGTGNAAMAAVANMRQAKPKPAPALYTPMLPP